MQEQIRHVASRIRELREISKVSTAQMARELQMPEDEYLRCEAGQVDLPVGMLLRVAQRFQVELTSLLTGEEPRLHTFAVTRAGLGVSVDRGSDYKYQSLAYNFIHKRAEPFLVTVDPGPGHANMHPGQEFHYVLEGTLQVTLGRREVVLEAGDSLYFDSNVPHCLTALHDRPARLLAVVV